MLPTLRLQKSQSFSPPPNRENEGVAGGGVRVWLMDESYKALHVDVDRITVEDLWNLVCDKVGLSPEASECFYLYGCGKELELLLVGEETVANVMRTWISVEHKYFPWVTFDGFEGGAAISAENDKEAAADKAASDAKEKDARAKLSRSSKLGESLSFRNSPTISRAVAIAKAQPPVRVVERPSPVRFFLKTADITPMALRKRTMSDSVGLRMLYVEAVYYVLKGWYPTSQQEAVRLGGLQLQAYLGDAGAAHVPGFLTSDNSWKNYVPKHLHHAGSPQQWEAMLLAEHTKHRGKTHDLCMSSYLNIAMEIPAYGSAFYNVKMQKTKTAFFSHEFDSSILLGVNEVGIHVIDAFSMKTETYAASKVKDWKASERFVTIYLKGDKKKLKFKTRQADLINELLGGWQQEWNGARNSVRASQRRPAAAGEPSL